MWFRRKRKRPPKPLCIHEWKLIDFRSVLSYNGVDIDDDDYYTIGCVKCNEKREMDESNYRKFKQVIAVKEDDE